MKKLIKKLKHNTMFGFILGGIIFGSIVYGANNYQSNSIEYSPTDSSWGVSNVSEAINSLYNMKTELDNIKSLGDATAAQILSGKKAVVKGNAVTGTMVNRGAVTKTLNAGGSYTIPAGYHNGSGKVTANTLASQTSATATASDILSGKTAYINGTKVTGAMANKGALNWNPSTSTSYIVPAGYYSGGTISTLGAYNAGVKAGKASPTISKGTYTWTWSGNKYTDNYLSMTGGSLSYNTGKKNIIAATITSTSNLYYFQYGEANANKYVLGSIYTTFDSSGNIYVNVPDGVTITNYYGTSSTEYLTTTITVTYYYYWF